MIRHHPFLPIRNNFLFIDNACQIQKTRRETRTSCVSNSSLMLLILVCNICRLTVIGLFFYFFCMRTSLGLNLMHLLRLHHILRTTKRGQMNNTNIRLRMHDTFENQINGRIPTVTMKLDNIEKHTTSVPHCKWKLMSVCQTIKIFASKKLKLLNQIFYIDREHRKERSKQINGCRIQCFFSNWSNWKSWCKRL